MIELFHGKTLILVKNKIDLLTSFQHKQQVNLYNAREKVEFKINAYTPFYRTVSILKYLDQEEILKKSVECTDNLVLYEILIFSYRIKIKCELTKHQVKIAHKP